MDGGVQSTWRRPLVLLCLVSALVACSDGDPAISPVRVLVLDENCDIQSGCIGRVDTLSVSVRMAPHRSALKPFNVTLSSDSGFESVLVSLEMQDMDMGQNRYRLLRADDGSWQADITLPICTSGRSDWVAVFDLRATDKQYRLSVPFTLGD